MGHSALTKSNELLIPAEMHVKYPIVMSERSQIETRCIYYDAISINLR